MFIEYDPEEDGPIIKSQIMLFSPGTRLMCPDCGTVSSKHLIGDYFFYEYSY